MSGAKWIENKIQVSRGRFREFLLAARRRMRQARIQKATHLRLVK